MRKNCVLSKIVLLHGETILFNQQHLTGSVVQACNFFPSETVVKRAANVEKFLLKHNCDLYQHTKSVKAHKAIFASQATM